MMIPLSRQGLELLSVFFSIILWYGPHPHSLAAEAPALTSISNSRIEKEIQKEDTQGTSQVYLITFLADIGLCCSAPGSLFRCSVLRLLQLQCPGFPCCRAQALTCVDSLVVECRLSCPMACGVFASQPEIETMSPTWEGRFLTTGSPGKSHQLYFNVVFLKLADSGFCSSLV